jgi:membrane protease YdiL (CAAX protease family)
MRTLLGRMLSAAWAALLAFLILAFAQGVWGGLLLTNLKLSPAIPWSVAAMAVVLWLMWQYLGGKGWPRKTSESRRRYLRANRISAEVFAWALFAGILSIVALTGIWIVMFELFRMPGNVLPDFSKYPLLTVALMLVMASLVSPFTEESAFRGYCQVILEREFRGPVAVLISSVLFALAHLTQGFFWPKQFVYFLAGLAFGVTAYLTRSILPGLAVHILADVTFFAFVWPYDAQRRLVWDGGADRWFWIHVAQAIAFTGLAIFAFGRLAKGRAVVSSTTQSLVGIPPAKEV